MGVEQFDKKAQGTTSSASSVKSNLTFLICRYQCGLAAKDAMANTFLIQLLDFNITVLILFDPKIQSSRNISPTQSISPGNLSELLQCAYSTKSVRLYWTLSFTCLRGMFHHVDPKVNDDTNLVPLTFSTTSNKRCCSFPLKLWYNPQHLCCQIAAYVFCITSIDGHLERWLEDDPASFWDGKFSGASC